MNSAEARTRLSSYAKNDVLITEIFDLTGIHCTYASLCRARVFLASIEGRLVGRQRGQYSKAREAMLLAVQGTADWVYTRMLWLECN